MKNCPEVFKIFVLKSKFSLVRLFVFYAQIM